MSAVWKRAVLGALLALAASVSGFAQSALQQKPAVVLEVTVDPGREADFQAALVRRLASMGFPVERDPLGFSTFSTKNTKIDHIAVERGAGYFTVAIYTGDWHAWKPVAAEIIRMTESLPYCRSKPR